MSNDEPKGDYSAGPENLWKALQEVIRTAFAPEPQRESGEPT